MDLELLRFRLNGMRYDQVVAQVRADTKVKEDKYGDIKAAKVKNEQDYELLKRYWTLACAPACFPQDIDVKGEYEGPDWYFFMKSSVDMGGWHLDEYWLESLGYKKKVFEEFCREYENIDENKDVNEK